MTRFLQWFNLVGVLALAALCVQQWRINRHLNHEFNEACKLCLSHSQNLGEKDRKLKSAAADLEVFRDQLTRATASLKETETKLAALDRQVKQLTNERDQLKTSVTNWAAAVTARDTQLKQAGADLKKIADDRNATVLKFNDLAAKQNDLVKEIERRTREHNAVIEELNKRTRDYNALVEKYNALAKQAQTAPPAKP
jgi:chromosome segregation ATPase